MNMITTEEEIAQSVYIFKRLLLIHEEYHSFLDKPDPYNDDEWFELVDKRMFTFKHKINNWLTDVEAEQWRSCKKASRIALNN